LSVRRAGSPTFEFYLFIKARAVPASAIAGNRFRNRERLGAAL
jgi:hypothetical protein